MGRFFDVSTDKNFLQLYSIYRNGLIKKAELDSLSQDVKLVKVASCNASDNVKFTKEAYADPALSLFPCINKAFTLLNWHYFLYQINDMPEHMVKYTVRNFKKFAEFFNVSDQLVKTAEKYVNNSLIDADKIKYINETFSTNLKKKIDYNDYALTYEKHGKLYAFFPIRNDSEVRLAIEFLKTKAKSIPFIYRVKMAKNILKKVEKTGSYLFEKNKEFLNKLLLKGHIKASVLLNELNRLLDLAFNPRIKVGKGQYTKKHAEAVYKWCKVLGKIKDKRIKASSCIKIIDLIDKAKREDGLYNLPEESIPENLIESGKKIKCPIHLKCGNILDAKELLGIPKDILKKSFGPEIEDFITNDFGAMDIEKLKSWAESLPYPDAKTLIVIIKKHKPSAVVDQKEESEEEIDEDEIDKLMEETEEETGDDIDEDKEKDEGKKYKKKVKKEDDDLSEEKEDDDKEEDEDEDTHDDE
jgi:hypothetical protein